MILLKICGKFCYLEILETQGKFDKKLFCLFQEETAESFKQGIKDSATSLEELDMEDLYTKFKVPFIDL